MEYVTYVLGWSVLTYRVGNTGLKISKIILGCMSFGDKRWIDWILDEEEALPLLLYAYQRGINTWDTADCYSNGTSENIVGKAIRLYQIPRDRIVLLSKCGYFVDSSGAQRGINPHAPTTIENVNGRGLSRKHIFDAVEASVKRLGTYIDVLQIHRLDRETPKEEIMRALNDVIEKGWVRYIGASSMAAWEFQELQHIADKHGWHKFISMQNLYNLLYREEEREMIPYCIATQVKVFPWYALAGGILTRPWGHKTTARANNDSFLEYIMVKDAGEADEEIVNCVEKIAQSHNMSMAQIALAWHLSKPHVIPIVGLTSKSRIDEAISAIQIQLSEQDISALEQPYIPKPVVRA
mgnify:FL=1